MMLSLSFNNLLLKFPINSFKFQPHTSCVGLGKPHDRILFHLQNGDNATSYRGKRGEQNIDVMEENVGPLQFAVESRDDSPQE